MSVRSRWVALLLAVAYAFLARAPEAAAKDHFLTIGGGYSVLGNQLSLERNVVFQQSVLAEKRPDNPPLDIFFADGDDECRDVQCRDADFEKHCPVAERMMSELFGDAYGKDIYYRNHELSHVQGPTERSLVHRRLRELAGDLKAGDRLIIYVAGHGAAAHKPYNYSADEDEDGADSNSDQLYNKFDTSFYLWNNQSVTASEFTRWLDQFDPEVTVVLVMVQCYAGGFAHTIFEQADAELGLSSHARCGFFAQRHDRGAAGCTPNANEADYQEYSSFFWAALGGKTRTGESVPSADYDGDGKVSFAEAHSYAVIESDTIDVPVRTSSALLAKYSSLGKGKAKSGSDGAFDSILNILEAGKKPGDKQAKTYVELKGPLKALAEHVPADQRAILEQMPAKLGLSSSPTVEEVKLRLGQINSNGKAASAQAGLARRAYSRAEACTGRSPRHLAGAPRRLHAVVDGAGQHALAGILGAGGQARLVSGTSSSHGPLQEGLREAVEIGPHRGPPAAVAGGVRGRGASGQSAGDRPGGRAQLREAARAGAAEPRKIARTTAAAHTRR